MVDRDPLIQEFLAGNGWGTARIMPLAGDASNRRYLRLALDGTRAVLMDAPPERGEDVRPFVKIAKHLRAAGLSPPEILASDPDRGFLLLEDLGDDLYARVLASHPLCEEPLYCAAVDALTVLARAPLPPALGRYDAPMMGRLAALSVTWYRAGTYPVGAQNDAAADGLEQAMATAVETACRGTDHGADTLVLRDYHAENLLWLPLREGVARVGQLDFQDALSGPPAYDLVSLLQDARRDVGPDVVAAMKLRFGQAAQIDSATFEASYSVLGAQRALRILGVFARLCMRDGKAHYVDLIPRVWAALVTNLEHPALADLRKLVETHLPAPTPSLLGQLKSRCKTHPTPR